MFNRLGTLSLMVLAICAVVNIFHDRPLIVNVASDKFESFEDDDLVFSLN